MCSYLTPVGLEPPTPCALSYQSALQSGGILDRLFAIDGITVLGGMRV